MSRLPVVLALISTSVFAQVPASDLEQVWLEPGGRGSLWVGNGQTLKGGQFRGGASLTFGYAPMRSTNNRTLVSDRFGLQVFGALGLFDWLEVSAPISPAQWLASRGEEKPRPIDDPEVQRIAARLSEAHTHYRESERMIANRAVQASEMLARIGISEPAVRILDDVIGIDAELGQTEGFGAVIQHYFNLRATRVSHAEAIATLKARYGSKS